MEKVKALHFLSGNGSFNQELFDEIGSIPGIELKLIENWESFTEDELVTIIQDCDVLIASRAPYIPDQLAENPGRLKYICYLHGTMHRAIGLPIIQSDIQVTNWGDRAGKNLAQDSLVLLLSVFKDLPKRIMAVRGGEGGNISSMGSSLSLLNIGIYGFGFSGREFARLVESFGMNIRVYDPFVKDLPAHCEQVNSLKDLFANSQAIVIHAGLTEGTENSITRELLALLPDQGIIINTARGAIIDQEPFFDELKSGRLRAGVDVLWPDNLPADHEARQWENLIWTCHQFGGSAWPSEGLKGRLRPFENFLNNIKAFVNGEELKFIIDEERYKKMT
ncbi:MAG: hypothetical protein COA79_13950 [Planctomycetota bacterium]|nr:MAG: hypothetical protein COA79_13950 [Planctomycetota bacterium]